MPSWRRPGRLYGRDPRGAARRQDRLHREGARARRHLLRVGCIPSKACADRFAIKEADETFAKLGVHAGEPQLDFATANQWKDGVVKQMTGGVAQLFKANGVEWVKGAGRFTDANTIAVEGGEDVTCTAIVATGSFPMRPPIEGLDSPRCVDSTGLLAQQELPKRLVVLGGGIIGCEFASIFARFGSEVTIIEMLPSLIPQEDDAAKGSRSSSASATSRSTSRSSAPRSRTRAPRSPSTSVRARPWRPT